MQNISSAYVEIPDKRIYGIFREIAALGQNLKDFKARASANVLQTCQMVSL
jgi:hypothetical protein